MNEGAIESIISPALFKLAQDERGRRNRRYDAAELIVLMQECYSRHGNITSKIIAGDRAMPDPQLFTRMFGSLVLAYDAAALPRSPLKGFVDTKRVMLTFRQKLFAEAAGLADRAGVEVTRCEAPYTLVFNGKCTLRVEVVTRRNPVRGEPNWKIIPREGIDFILLARFDPDAAILLDYYLVPAACLTNGAIYLKEKNLPVYSPLVFDELQQIFGRGNA